MLAILKLISLQYTGPLRHATESEFTALHVKSLAGTLFEFVYCSTAVSSVWLLQSASGGPIGPLKLRLTPLRRPKTANAAALPASDNDARVAQQQEALSGLMCPPLWCDGGQKRKIEDQASNAGRPYKKPNSS